MRRSEDMELDLLDQEGCMTRNEGREQKRTNRIKQHRPSWIGKHRYNGKEGRRCIKLLSNEQR